MKTRSSRSSSSTSASFIASLYVIVRGIAYSFPLCVKVLKYSLSWRLRRTERHFKSLIYFLLHFLLERIQIFLRGNSLIDQAPRKSGDWITLFPLLYFCFI